MQVSDLRNEDEVVFGPKVRAIYYQLRRYPTTTTATPPDEFDVTLISPNMIDDEIADSEITDLDLDNDLPTSQL
jgi:hypothetical protein